MFLQHYVALLVVILIQLSMHLNFSDGGRAEMFVTDYFKSELYWAIADGDGSFTDANYTKLPLQDVSSPMAVQFDQRTRLVYWTDINRDVIYRAKLDGSEQEAIVSDGLISPQGLSIDIFNERLYWTDSGTDRIESASLDGSNRSVLVDTGTVDQPRGIVVSRINGLIFWADWGAVPKIERANVDGTGRRVIISDDITQPHGVALNQAESRVYWSDPSVDHVDSALLDGSDRVRHVEVGALTDIHPFNLALYGPHDDVYFTDTNYAIVITLDVSTGEFDLIGWGSYFFQRPAGIFINQDHKSDFLCNNGNEHCHNGVCVDKYQNGTEMCECFPGFDQSDPSCGSEINECDSSPCKAGTCIDLINAFTCQCPPSHKGVTCQEEVNQCSQNNPCQNGGTCIDDIFDYECVCRDGFYGRNCQKNSTACDSNPCQNQGLCETSEDIYMCHCRTGFTGTNCETNINDCSTSSCSGNGLCMDGINDYNCTCYSGFTGTRCQVRTTCARPLKSPEGTEFEGSTYTFVYGDALTVSCLESEASTVWICQGFSNWLEHELVCESNSALFTMTALTIIFALLLVIFVFCSCIVIYRQRQKSSKFSPEGQNGGQVRMDRGEVRIDTAGGVSNNLYGEAPAPVEVGDVGDLQAPSLPEKETMTEDNVDLCVDSGYVTTMDDVPLRPPSYAEH